MPLRWDRWTVIVNGERLLATDVVCVGWAFACYAAGLPLGLPLPGLLPEDWTQLIVFALLANGVLLLALLRRLRNQPVIPPATCWHTLGPINELRHLRGATGPFHCPACGGRIDSARLRPDQEISHTRMVFGRIEGVRLFACLLGATVRDIPWWHLPLVFALRVAPLFIRLFVQEFRLARLVDRQS